MQNRIFLLLKYFSVHGKFLGIIDDNPIQREYIKLCADGPFILQDTEMRGKMPAELLTLKAVTSSHVCKFPHFFWRALISMMPLGMHQHRS